MGNMDDILQRASNVVMLTHGIYIDLTVPLNQLIYWIKFPVNMRNCYLISTHFYL